MESIKNRRTIRKYKSQDIPADLLNALIEEASRAATMGNMQLYSVVITRSEEMKSKLAPMHFNQPMVTNSPVVLTFCADFNRFSLWCRQRKAEPGYDNFLSFINALSDTLLFTQNSPYNIFSMPGFYVLGFREMGVNNIFVDQKDGKRIVRILISFNPEQP